MEALLVQCRGPLPAKNKACVFGGSTRGYSVGSDPHKLQSKDDLMGSGPASIPRQIATFLYKQQIPLFEAVIACTPGQRSNVVPLETIFIQECHQLGD